jgi:tetratricopeptide (TPR) repeat protein
MNASGGKPVLGMVCSGASPLKEATGRAVREEPEPGTPVNIRDVQKSEAHVSYRTEFQAGPNSPFKQVFFMAKSLQSLFDRAASLKQRGKLNDAIDIYRKAVKQFPDSGVAEHNLAGTLGNAGRPAEAEKHIRRAFKKGLNAPESWLVLARVLMSQGKLAESQDAFEKTLNINPAVLDAQRELAQLVWMMTGDSKKALARIDETIRSFPQVAVLHHIKAQALKSTEGPAAALAFTTKSLERWPNDVTLLVIAANTAVYSGEIDAALDLSKRVMKLQPGSRSANECLVTALLAAGRPKEALPIMDRLYAEDPNDQHVIALLATTYRLLGDDRYEQIYNYEDFVRQYDLAVPKGWSSLTAYLDDLRTGLAERHPYKTHPFMNSLNGGSMIMDFEGSDNPAMRALLTSLKPAIDEHLIHLGQGSDAVRSRNTGRWKLDGIWSVYLRPNGFHHDHVHPNGWLSSACYIELPDRLETEDKEGWIKFGEPGVVTEPKLSYEHAIKPKVGTIALFPSYMWHGTVPFGGEQRRMTCALDVVPD